MYFIGVMCNKTYNKNATINFLLQKCNRITADTISRDLKPKSSDSHTSLEPGAVRLSADEEETEKRGNERLRQ